MLDSLPGELHAQAALLLALPETQAHLRRSISANYYALFHLLIIEATQLWSKPEHQPKLARQFDHKRMKEASVALVNRLTPERTKLKRPSRNYDVLNFLFSVANTFITLQQERHRADYNLSISIPRKDAQTLHDDTTAAFESWSEIKDEPLAHDYLYSLLFKDRY